MTDPFAAIDTFLERWRASLAPPFTLAYVDGFIRRHRAQVETLIADTLAGYAAPVFAPDPDRPQEWEILIRLKRLPGFGEQKARIFLALLGKQYGLTAPGWQDAAGDYGRAGTHMSVADVRDKASLDQVRSYKKQMKAEAKSAKAAKA